MAEIAGFARIQFGSGHRDDLMPGEALAQVAEMFIGRAMRLSGGGESLHADELREIEAALAARTRVTVERWRLVCRDGFVYPFWETAKGLSRSEPPFLRYR